MGKGGVRWWHAPFLRVWGGATKGVPGGVMPSCTPSWEGKGQGEREGGSSVPSYAPLLWEWAARPRGKGWDQRRRGSVPSCAPIPREWRREALRGETAAYPCAHSFRVNGKGGAGERGRGGRRGQGAGRTGGDREKGQRCAHTRPFHTARTWEKGRGGWCALVCCLSTRTRWHGQRVREGGSMPPFLHAKGRSVRGRERGGRGLTLVCPLSALKWGGGQCGGKRRQGRGRLTPHVMKGKGWGVGLSSCVFSST
ncbi:hypothetical protein EDB86DRAFT_2828625 [Lactarius hatsudake]|nr:hypothetical protein EDB86DRAFT_2828625 [Lactarius hatsudake]